MHVTPEMISGTTQVHLSELAGSRTLLHSAVITPWLKLKQAAQTEGIDIQIASSFRSFDRQLAIWNQKVSGERPVLSDSGQPLNLKDMDDLSKVLAILRWSGLPGASRHHWGTDIDVWDCSAVPNDYCLKLVPEEYSQGGPFCALSEWLDEKAASFGFSRPYERDAGGVAPELWHLSYRAVADEFESHRDKNFLTTLLNSSNMQLKETVLDNFDLILKRFVALTE